MLLPLLSAPLRRPCLKLPLLSVFTYIPSKPKTQFCTSQYRLLYSTATPISTTMAPSTFKLNCGLDMPAIGFGTWQAPDAQVTAAVEDAIEAGYKMIDGAYCYGNEKAVGQGIKNAIAKGICKREDIFVVTKLWNTYASRVEEGLNKSLQSLGLEYVDQFLVHWPVAMNPNGKNTVGGDPDRFPMANDGAGPDRDMVLDHDHVATWKQMESVLKSGKTKSIGVSNYSTAYLNNLLAKCEVVPAVNQIENHPRCPQKEIVDLCKSKGIHVVAYSPLAMTQNISDEDDKTLGQLATKYSCSKQAILLSYNVARGISVLSKSVTKQRIIDNLKLVDLEQSDVAALDALTTTGPIKRTCWPAFKINLGFPDRTHNDDGSALRDMINGTA